MRSDTENLPWVLAVDDDEDMIAIIRLRLKKMGIKCHVAYDVTQALEIEAQLDNACLLLVDHMMPSGTGLDVMQPILARRPDTATIVMSSSEDAKAVVRYMKAGARDYLFKGDGFLDMLEPVVNKTLESMQRILRLKKAEQSIQLHEGLLSRSQKMAKMGSWRREISTRDSIWSDNMYHILETSPDLVSDPREDWFLARVHPDDRALLVEAWDATMTKKHTTSLEFRIMLDNGKERIFKAVHDADIKEEGVSLYGLLQDITEEKQAQLERLKLSQAVDQSAASIIITDTNGIVEYVNQRFTKVTGYSREEVLGRNPRFLKSGEHTNKFYEKLWKTLLDGRDWQGEFCNKTKSGQLIWESASISCIKNEKGETINFLSIKEDVTEKKKFHKSMFKLNKALIAANRETEKLAADFELFVPKQFIQRMREEGPGAIRSGFAQEESITMLFADIRSFTTLSESMGSESTFAFLNDYLHRIEPCIKGNNGFVDKFVGDGIIALFDGDDSPSNAVKAAVAMQEEVHRFNRERPNDKDIVLGIGLHRGRVIIGALGSDSRLDSTVIGDSVNVTSRIEELTKRFRAQILLTKEVLDGIDPSLYCIRKTMTLKVRGRHNPTEVYEIFDHNAPKEKELKQNTRDQLQKAITLYDKHCFGEAYEIFDEIQHLNTADVLATDYAIRCRYLRKFPSSELSNIDFLEDLNHYLNHSTQRRDIRHDVDLAGKIKWAEQSFEEERVSLTNLSLRGVKVESCSLPLTIGSIIKIDILVSAHLPHISSDVEVVSQVVWASSETNPSYGLQFVWMDRHHENTLLSILEHVNQDDAPPQSISSATSSEP